MEFVTTIQYTLLINGNISKSFTPRKGLRQGNPLSSYLFLICANILSLALMKAENQKRIRGVKIDRNGISFTHLFFVDDALLFFQQDNQSLIHIQEILNWYCSLSGQSINLSNFDLYCSPNMEEEVKGTLAQDLSVNLVQSPSKYLSLNFMLRGKRIADFQFLVDKMHSKLQGWKAKLLSQAGRTTLIKSTLQSMPIYTFNYFKMPKAICNKMDVIFRAFQWGHDLGEKRMHLVNWDMVCKPKREGGLALRKFGLMNQAMLAKQFWRISQNPYSLISKTFKAKYFTNASIHECSPKPHHSQFQRGIINQKNSFLKEGMWIIGLGTNIPLNHSAWFPCQLHLLNQHNLSTDTVADLIDHTNHSWNPGLVKTLYPHPISEEILNLPISKIGIGIDKLVWKHSSSGDYQVKKAYNFHSKWTTPLDMET